MEFVFDRTKTDVLLGTKKGSYSAEDLNRVESAVAELSVLAKELGVTKPFITKTNWRSPGLFSVSEWPTKSQMQRYLENVTRLCDAVAIKGNLPTSMEKLTWEKANKIEQSLSQVYERIRLTVKMFRYSGEIFSGEESYL